VNSSDKYRCLREQDARSAVIEQVPPLNSVRKLRTPLIVPIPLPLNRRRAAAPRVHDQTGVARSASTGWCRCRAASYSAAWFGGITPPNCLHDTGLVPGHHLATAAVGLPALSNGSGRGGRMRVAVRV
jgi:hypothetical protein